MLVLGIESSCDETAAALVRDGREMVSSVISSQVEIHKRFGGVVPELASREHLEKIVPVVEEAFARAGIAKEEIDGVAVTQGPGLVGSLLVGLSFAKAMAYALEKPFVGVNHIEGHIYSVVFDNPPIEYPAFALVVSGGHTNLFLVPEPGRTRCSRARATTRRARRTTRWRRCSGSAIRAGPSSRGWRATATRAPCASASRAWATGCPTSASAV